MNIDIVGSDNKRPGIFNKYLLRDLTSRSLVLAFLISAGVANCPAQARPKAPAQSSPVYSDGLKKWTVQDSVRVRYILTRKELEADDGRSSGYGTDAIVPSPGGKYFFFVSRHGDLKRNCNVYEMSVYAVSEVESSLASGATKTPLPLRSVAMCHQRQAIKQPRWVEGDTAIEFRGSREVDGPEQVYRLDLGSGRLKALTQLSGKQLLSTYMRQGDTLIYNVSELVMEDVPAQGAVYSLTQARVGEIVRDRGVRRRYISHTYVSSGGPPAWRMKSGWAGGPAVFSPDGRRVLMMRIPEQVPENWARYNAVAEKMKLEGRTRVDPQDFSQYMLVDVENQRETPVFDAPTGWASAGPGGVQALWSADGKRVVLVGTALPLEPEGTGGENTGKAYIISYEVDTGRWEVLEEMLQPSGVRAMAVGWRRTGQEFLVMHILGDKLMPGTTYTLSGSRWIPKTVDATVGLASLSELQPVDSLMRGVTVSLRQSASDPPKVVAALNGREIALTGPDPALDGVGIARTQPFQWKDGEGTMRTGGLLLPRDMPRDGSRIPLVIQATPYLPDEFRPDGLTRAGFAAQALVAQGMAVLNIGVPTGPERETRGPAWAASKFIDWVDTAAETAARAHPIDLQRVGLLGWSNSGFLTYHTVTNPRRVRLGAAISHDGNQGSYFLTLIYAAMGDVTAPAAIGYLYGGSFYEAKTSWLEEETSFNVDRVQTPMLFVYHGGQDKGDNVVFELDTIGAFQIASKPAEFLVIPGAPHDLSSPKHREASLEATVDWMNFWLQGREDARPEKTERYARWRVQRELHAKNLAKAAKNPKPAANAAKPTVDSDRQKVLDEMKAAGVADPGRDPQTLNAIGYKAMYDENDKEKALRYFRWNVVLFANTRVEANLLDSLGEGYLIAGDVEKAIEAYSKAYEINPEMKNARSVVTRLKADRKNLPALQEEARQAYKAAVANQPQSQ